MEKIASFKINHMRLLTGLYLSRKDKAGEETITTFDLRMTRPNAEPVMDTAAVHAIEHLGATYLRSREDWKERIIYFGPMGCRTGFYLVVAGELTPEDILPLIKDTFYFITGFEGEIPGASATDCGNYLDMNLSMAKYHAEKYLREALEKGEKQRFTYPEE